MADNAADAVSLFRIRRVELDFNIRADVQVGDGEESHAAHTDIHPECLHMSRSSEHFHRVVPPLARPAALGRVVGSEKHAT